MKISFLMTVLVLCAAQVFGGNKPVDFTRAATPNVTFTENKGQIGDQFYRPRPDVLFSGKTSNMSFHLRNNGISYQFFRVDAWKEEADLKQYKATRKVPASSTIYRLDISWLNANSHAETVTDQVLPGYANYYLEQCPSGLQHVQSYKGVTYKNIYNAVDLHYYEKDGHLKYDYLVGAGADYRSIKMQVNGAKKIMLTPQGELTIETPLGTLTEEAPVVMQQGRTLPAAWVIKNNEISFLIEGIDATKPFVIDPGVRAWGTYFGGAEGGSPYAIATDAAGNVNITGATLSTANIATVGSFQTTLGASGSYDAYLSNFNTAGVLQWSTYYGTSFDEEGDACAVDGSGNVFMSGTTQNNTTTVLTTPGSYQVSSAGNNEVFLVKFSPAGARIWATYYGSPQSERSSGCAVDAAGNVFITGITNSTLTTAIASSGAYQTTYGGLGSASWGDAFIAKFSASGVKQWSSYYGGSGDDYPYDCTTDAAGNFYFTGYTESATGTVIATPGSHQPAFNGGNDAFLVKMSPAGARLWATYYGTSGYEVGYGCATDASGNVFMTGLTNITSGTLLATPGSYQPAPASTYDAFLVKFNSSGVRQWGTYYGGNNDESGQSCSTDLSGNVYIAGGTSSTAGISTSGSHQPAFGGGGSDAFLAKFNATGVRQWGTYYGGTAFDNCSSKGKMTDAAGNVYISGTTYSGSGISTAGSQQAAYPAGSNSCAFIVKFFDCGPDAPVNTSSNQTGCANSSATLQAVGSGTITWFATNSSTVVLSTGSSFVTPTLSAGTYSYYAAANTCSASALRAEVVVTVVAAPSISVTSGTVCSGQSFTIVPSGANTYSITGNTFTVSPSSTASYSVTGTSTAGCVSNAAVSTISVNATPTITVNSGTICSNKSFTIIPGGANAYTITGNNFTVTPLTTTSYSVTGTGTNGCVGTNTAVATVSVNATPTLAVNSATICSNTSVAIVPTGAGTYTITGNSFTVTPLTTTQYSVTGTGTNGCVGSNTAVSTVSVNASPTLAVNSATVCSGNSVAIVPAGANTYTITGNNFTVTPLTTTPYSVTGTGTNGCVGSNTAVATVSVNATPTISVNSGSICSNKSFTITPGGANTYSITGGSFTVTPLTTASYSVTGTGTNGCISSAVAVSNVTVNASPTLAVNSATICSGNSMVIVPTGAGTYSITGNSFTVTPFTTTLYSITGTSSLGCSASNTVVATVSVNASPTLAVNSTTACLGSSVVIAPTGAATYTISGNHFTVTPLSTTSYSITGTDVNGCLSPQAVSTITVISLPPVSASAQNATVCSGVSAVLNAEGAASYAWNTGAATASIAVTLTITTDYTVTGTALSGCTNTVTVKQIVDPCTGLKQHSSAGFQCRVYPNPGNGLFMIDVTEASHISVYTQLGQLIISNNLQAGTNAVNIGAYADGVYMLLIEEHGTPHYKKIIKQ